jgi:hypothetical protein
MVFGVGVLPLGMYSLWPRQVIALFSSAKYASAAEHLWLLGAGSIDRLES